MDQDLIIELSKIKDLLSIIVVLLGLVVGGKVIEMIGNISNNWRSFRTSRVRGASNDMHKRGEYAKLLEYLTKEMKSHPNCPTSIYWMARSYLSLSDYENAKTHFLKLKELEPSWDDEYVSPFMHEIEEKR